MTILLNIEETSMIIESFNFRYQSSKEDSDRIRIDKILSRRFGDFITIKDNDKNYIIRCLEESHCSEYCDRKYSDIELLFVDINQISDFLKIDKVYELQNKLLLVQEKSRAKILFSTRFTYLNQFKNIENIYYSFSNNNYHKIGIQFTNKKGINYNEGESVFQNFTITPIIKSDFTSQCTPSEFLSKINLHLFSGTINSQNETLSQIKQLIEKFS